MKIEDLKSYSIIEKTHLNDQNSEAYLLKHKKTGAKVVLLSNDDENKVFYIGFRTPPTDSTGVAHIIEHSVLCGSEKYPVKDPFIELAKGSLNTFLNAMTFPDKTVYPVASCNDKDLRNLMDVYLDAVFHPNIYKEEKIFKQEGWHYELESEDSELSINGVVYNEMKGAFSSPDDVFDREVLNSLYPDTAYGVESGGDPEDIPNLSYENFLDFHGKYYHPSNSYIYLYGDMDMAKELDYIDKEYLSKYDYLEIDSEIKNQASFSQVKTVCKIYSIMDSESEENNTYLSYNACFGDTLDPKLYIAFQILDYALCSSTGAPVKQLLTDNQIGNEIYSVFENGIRQPYFSIVAKGANESDKEKFVELIEECLCGLRDNGIDKKALLAGLNYYEFRYREADFGSYPKGLITGLQVLDSWLYDENKPFIHIEAGNTYKELKEDIDSGFFEKLIDSCILQNSHKSIVILKPQKGLTAAKEKELSDKLEKKKASLGKEQIESLICETKALKEYQEEPDSAENLEKIPLLTRADLKKEAQDFCNEETSAGNYKLLYHDIFTNGIGYIRLMFNLKDVPERLFKYLPLLKNLMGYVNTNEHTYNSLNNDINIYTGGMIPGIGIYSDILDIDKYELFYEVKSKFTYENTDKAFELMQEMMLCSDYSDEKRLKEVLSEMRSQKQATLSSQGHSVALMRGMSYLSKQACISEVISGMDGFRFLEKLDDDFDNQKSDLIDAMNELVRIIFRPEYFMIDYAGERKSLDAIKEKSALLADSLFAEEFALEDTFEPKPVKKNEAFMTSGQVQFVARTGNFINHGYKYTGALKVLKVMMGYDYLWNAVRVRGGAYGCMCVFGKSGDCVMVSYRDPNLEKTVETFEKAPEFIESFTADERTMTKYIIGTVSDLDAPMTPSSKASRSLGAYMSHQTFEMVQQERDEVLSCSENDIRSLASHIRAFLEDDCLCVVGSEASIKDNESLFLSTQYLFS